MRPPAAVAISLAGMTQPGKQTGKPRTVCAWDTSGEVVSVGLGVISPGSGLASAGVELVEQVGQVQIPAARRHAETLAPALQNLLDQAGWGVQTLDAVIVGTGPGPFTGLRVGLATAQVFGLARQIPVLGVCSLDALAWQAARDGVTTPGRPLWVITDALRREVHALRYDVGATGEHPQVQRSTQWQQPQVVAPDQLSLEPDAVIIGSGAARYPQVFAQATPPLDPSAAALIGWVGAGLPTTVPRPLYLRRPDVTVSAAVVPA